MESSTSSRPVVVVDDNADDLFFFKRCLAKAGVTHPLVVANDGEEAIARLKEIGAGGTSPTPVPLMVFLDLKMPRVSGFTVLEWIRAQRPLDAVPVAILSSSAEPRDISQAYALGAQTYLVKHPTAQDMAATMAAVHEIRTPGDLRELKLPGLALPR